MSLLLWSALLLPPPNQFHGQMTQEPILLKKSPKSHFGWVRHR
ncbi:MAG: hypothetical protein R2857_12070 [Vampirovibrionales bacterium]